MLESSVRKHYEAYLLEPVLRRISPYWTPVKLTVLSGILGSLFLPALLLGFSWVAIVLLVLSGYCDTLDGALARWQKSHSNLGAVLDILTDRIVECVAVLALCLVDSSHRGLASISMLISIVLCITSFLVVGIFIENQSHKSFHYSEGIMERAEAFVFFILMVLLPSWFNGLAYVFTALVLLTAFIRVAQFAANEMQRESLPH